MIESNRDMSHSGRVPHERDETTLDRTVIPFVSRDHVLVVGGRKDRELFCQWIHDVERSLRTLDWKTDLAARVQPSTRCIVFAGRPPCTEATRALRTKLLEVPRDVPAVVMVHPDTSDLCAWHLYGAGATAVERLENGHRDQAAPAHLQRLWGSLPAALLRDLGARNLRLSAAGRLEESIRLRLRLASRRYVDLGLDVSGGAVRVRGAVDLLDDRRVIREVVADAPGVSTVDAEDLVVLRDASPEALVALVRARVADALGDDHTLHVNIIDGRVVLAGSVTEPTRLQQLLADLWTTPGVSDVENDVIVDAEQAGRDRALARRIRVELLAAQLDHSLRIGIIGPFVVISGGDRSPDLRRAAMTTVLDVPGVNSVIDADGGQATH